MFIVGCISGDCIGNSATINRGISVLINIGILAVTNIRDMLIKRSFGVYPIA